MIFVQHGDQGEIVLWGNIYKMYVHIMTYSNTFFFQIVSLMISFANLGNLKLWYFLHANTISDLKIQYFIALK